MPSVVRAADATERRLVSVLFVDLVGSTPFAEAHDAEDVRAMLTRYFDDASDAVRRHGGKVEKFIGDAVMAVWGTPTAHEDDAERAVRAALEVVDRVAALGDELGVTLRARGGVLTGEAVADRAATDQGIVTGDLVNTAARFQSAAQPGTVLVGERTQRASSTAILFERVADLELKGKSEPASAWRAVRVVGEVGGANRGNAPEPPFVGRADELRVLKEWLHATGREQRPKLITTVGVAGIGKSRLVWELVKYVDGLTEGTYWHQGRCPSYGDGVTFWALAEMVRSRARIADTDEPARASELLDNCLSEFVTDEDERSWIRPALRHLIGLDSASGASRDELFGAWRQFFERIAQRGTVVLVIEDLQWADQGVMDFLESLLEWSRTSPILILAQTRPELIERRPTWGSAARSSMTIHVDRLSDAEIVEMVSGYVVGLPDEGMARLVSRAEGVPLYAVETIRMLADRGVLAVEGESYRVEGVLDGELDIPETLHALVAARLDGLPESERALVQDAAVAGLSFTVDVVSAMSGLSLEDAEVALRGLVRKEVLDQENDPRSPERGQFLFVQSVIQEVAYATLSKSARRSKHLACARWYESLGVDDLVGVVATHFLEAYLAEPSARDAEDVATLAREYLGKAADRAFTLGSPEQAFDFAQRAQSLARDSGEAAALYATSAIAAGDLGRLDIAFEHMVTACDAFRTAGDVIAEAELLANNAQRGYPAAKQEQMTVRMKEVIDLLPEEALAPRVKLYAAMANRLRFYGDSVEGAYWSNRAMELASVSDNDELLIWAAAAHVWTLAATKRQWEAEQVGKGLIDLARRSAPKPILAASLLSWGILLAATDPIQSQQATLEAYEIGKRLGVVATWTTALANSVEGALDLGQLEQAEFSIKELESVTTLDENHKLTVALDRATLAALKGDDATARTRLDDVSSTLNWDTLPMRTWYLRVESLRQELSGDYRAAVQTSLESLTADPAGMNAPQALWQGLRSAIAMQEPQTVRQLLKIATGIRGRWTNLVRSSGEAYLLACTGELTGSAQLIGESLTQFDAMRLPLDHAFFVTVAYRCLPVDLRPHDDFVAALAFSRSIGATPIVRLLEEVSEPVAG